MQFTILNGVGSWYANNLTQSWLDRDISD